MSPLSLELVLGGHLFPGTSLSRDCASEHSPGESRDHGDLPLGLLAALDGTKCTAALLLYVLNTHTQTSKCYIIPTSAALFTEQLEDSLSVTVGLMC